MENKLTAIEWLVKQLNTHGFVQVVTDEEIQQALAMEKEQIIDAYKYGNLSDVYFKPEQYYNETFKK
jgi:hypothetical protein